MGELSLFLGTDTFAMNKSIFISRGQRGVMPENSASCSLSNIIKSKEYKNYKNHNFALSEA